MMNNTIGWYHFQHPMPASKNVSTLENFCVITIASGLLFIGAWELSWLLACSLPLLALPSIPPAPRSFLNMSCRTVSMRSLKVTDCCLGSAAAYARIGHLLIC